jgi:cell division protease FtsH
MLEVKKLVKEYDSFVHAIAEQLLQRGDLTGDEIEEIFVQLYGHSRPILPDVKPPVLNAPSKETPAKLLEKNEEESKDSE